MRVHPAAELSLQRIRVDQHALGARNHRLTEWWALDFAGFRHEVKKALGREIPLKERDEWEGWLAAQRQRHEQHTAEIVRPETELNERVYALFGLTYAEIEIIEESTKYEYGRV